MEYKNSYSMRQATKEAYQRILDYKGRSTRLAFWMFLLAQFILLFPLLLLSIVLSIILAFVMGISIVILLDTDAHFDAISHYILLIALIFGFGSLLIIPFFASILIFLAVNISLSCRRLADSGKSPWLIFLALIPVIGPLIILILCCFDSERGRNQWGTSLKHLN